MPHGLSSSSQVAVVPMHHCEDRQQPLPLIGDRALVKLAEAAQPMQAVGGCERCWVLGK